MNQWALRHSVRNLPLNDSMNALSVGLPGREKSNPSIAVTHARLGDLLDPFDEAGLPGPSGAVVIGRTLDWQSTASATDAHLPGCAHMIDHRPLAGTAGEHEAERASLTICAGVDFALKAAAASTRTFLMRPPFAPAAREWPRTHRGAVDHMLPVVGEPKLDQRFQQGVPHPLLGAATEPDIDRVTIAIAFVHVAPGAADPKHVEHSVQKTAIVQGRPGPPATLGRQQCPNHSPLNHPSDRPEPNLPPLNGSLESVRQRFGNPFCQHGLGV